MSDKKIRVVLMMAIVVLTGALVASNVDTQFRLPALPAPVTTVKETPASVELYKFNDLSSNTSLTTEIWLKNTGSRMATNIKVFVRSRNQTGAVLFEGNVKLSGFMLKYNETCIGIYSITFTNATKNIYHTLEVTWNAGRQCYQRETLI